MEPAHYQLVDLEAFDARPSDGEASNRQRAERDRAERETADGHRTRCERMPLCHDETHPRQQAGCVPG